MGQIYTSVDQLIGKTPLLEFTNVEKKLGLYAKVIGKLEYLNPAGSVKDRVAKFMIDEAEKSGKVIQRLLPGYYLITFNAKSARSSSSVSGAYSFGFYVVLFSHDLLCPVIPAEHICSAGISFLRMLAALSYSTS